MTGGLLKGSLSEAGMVFRKMEEDVTPNAGIHNILIRALLRGSDVTIFFLFLLR